jgi:hypothetical protein
MVLTQITLVGILTNLCPAQYSYMQGQHGAHKQTKWCRNETQHRKSIASGLPMADC